MKAAENVRAATAAAAATTAPVTQPAWSATEPDTATSVTAWATDFSKKFHKDKNIEQILATTDVIIDYLIHENVEMTDNETNQTNQENLENNNSTTDTYNQTNLTTNIDSYYSNNPKNIDSFFNTALLDNQFMYGNGGLYGGYAYGMNPYLNQYAQYEKNQNYNSANGVNNTNNTQNIENIPSDNVDEDGEKIGNKERKKLNIKKNIDTYRDENTPDLKTRFNNFKQTISNAFGKIDPKNDIKHPVYKY